MTKNKYEPTIRSASERKYNVIKFAVIGTSEITDKFIVAARGFENFHLEAVYSREYTKGLAFGKKYSCCKVYTDLDELGADPVIDAVYSASPNSFHCPQAIKLMGYKKHVLCEKPFASDSYQVAAMIAVANANNVLLMEAMKTPFMPVLHNVKNQLQRIGKIRRAFFHYSQYSSRYDNYRNGIVENAFKPELSNGALVDIGIYPLFAMLYFFGDCTNLSASAQFLESGVDGIGTISLKYADFLGDIQYSKISNSLIPNEIQGEDGNILINRISMGASATMQLRNGEIVDLGTEKEDSFFYEIKEFLTLIENGQLESKTMSHQVSQRLMATLDEVRRQIGLVYPTNNIDKKNIP